MSDVLPSIEIFTPGEKRAALDRALTSRTFSRSEQLRSFLQFICEAEFRGESSSINEYIIGTEVLHRPGGYSPAEDSSVRTRAYELRQKLERLYAAELPDEAVHIAIPKGGYTPQFVRGAAIGPTTVLPQPHEMVVAAKTGSNGAEWRWPAVAAVVAAAVLGAAGGFLLARARVDTRALPTVVREAWAQVARPNEQALLVAATPLYLVLGPETHGAYGTPIYPAPPEAYPMFRQHRPLAKANRLGMLFTSDALGVGSMDAVVIASNTIRELGSAAEILPERASMMPVLHGRNVVLFGAPVDSEVISEILSQTPLTVDYDEGVKEFVIRDRSSGQLLIPEKSEDGDFRSVYGLVTVLNTRESERGRLGTIVFSGITSVGTHGAAEYFASPRSLEALRRIFLKSGHAHFPAAYQVVVRCSIENLLLVSEEYQTHRILQAE